MPRLRQPREAAPPASVRFQQEEPAEDPNKAFEQQEPEAEPEETPIKQQEPDAAAELKKQIEALKRAEQEQRDRADRAEQERQQAHQEAKTRTAELEKIRGESVQTQADLINQGIAKETEAAEAAERDLEAAFANGDGAAVAKAQRRISQAEAKLVALQNGKAAIETQIEEAKKQQAEPPPQREMTFEERVDSWPYPDSAKRWMKSHKEWLTDERKRAKLNAAHFDVIDEGAIAYTPQYYEKLETRIGLREAPEEERESSSSIVSAPPSREVPSGSGTRNSGSIRLTPAQKDAAKMAGITEVEYAKQLLKLQQEKDSGNYGERR